MRYAAMAGYGDGVIPVEKADARDINGHSG